MSKKIFVLLAIFSILFITCSRILDSENNKLQLTGKVLNKVTNQPVSEAEVSISGEEKMTLTDEQGNFAFSFDIDEKKTLTVTVTKDSFETVTFTHLIKPGKDSQTDNILLNPEELTTTIKGTLLNAFNNEAIEGGDIKANVVDYSVYTNSTGNFEISFETNEALAVQLICKKNYFVSDTLNFSVQPGTTHDLENIFLSYIYSPAKISGKVVDARADTALSDVKVSLVGETNVYTTSNVEGEFLLEAQINETGPVSVMFSKYSFYSNIITIDQISPEEELSVEEVQLSAPSYSPVTVHGKVVNNDGEGVENAAISVTQFPDIEAETNSTGRFSFSLQIDKEMEVTFVIDHDQYISLEADTTALPETILDLGAITVMNRYEAALIKGTVVNKRTGSPLFEAKIVDKASGKYTSTDDEGEFELALPVTEPTSITLAVSKYPFESKDVTLDQVTPEDVLEIGSISLEPPEYEPITISGQVLDTDTRLMISDVNVYIEEMPELATATDNYGNFTITAQVDSVSEINIHITKSDVYNGVVLKKTLEPETDLWLGQIELDSKYDPIAITGRVLNYTGSVPLEGVAVSIVEFPEHYTKTNAVGEFLLNPVITEERKIHLAFAKAEFLADTAEVSVSPNTDINISDIPLLEKITRPASIVFLGADPQDIRVKESGGVENAILKFEVRDSSGIAIDVSEDTTVFVEIVAGPDGGESIYPNVLRTNSKGIVTSSLTSGTIAGAVQVEAYLFTEDGKKIKSNPATLVIHAGHPDAGHFSIAAEQLNIPGLVTSGIEDVITAYVADKYGNWVADGTPVYFTANGGGIQGFANTVDAEATVILQSGHKDPEPTANGFVTITAKTSNVDNQTIQTTGLVLFSGHSEITNFSPANISLTQNSTATVTFNVWDAENHNPLAAGSKLNVSVSPDTLASVQCDFPEDGLGDVQYGHTSYSFTVVDNPSNISGGELIVKLKLSSPNGNLTAIRKVTLTVP
jgi:protocatechuate 3,4-dioxygenase beta subunit